VAGPIALVGSGEFLEAMRAVDEQLLAGRRRVVAVLATAAAEEGPARVAYWFDLARAHYAELEAEVLALPVLERADAERADLASLLHGAGLVYLSGGNPGYLAATLRSSACWEAICAAHRAGAALAGCSAGAMALGAVAPDVRRASRVEPGLGLLPTLAVVPHFDHPSGFAERLLGRVRAASGPEVHVVGIEEETALVGGPHRFAVAGRGAAWVIGPGAARRRYGRGELLEIGGRLEEGALA